MTSTSAYPDPHWETRGCPVCDVAGRALFDFLAHWQFALATDDEARRRHAMAGGFCPLHSWQLATWSSAAGLASACETMVEHVADALDEAFGATDGAVPGRTPALPAPAGRPACAACQVVAYARSHTIRQVARLIETDDGRAAYARSGGICLPDLPPLLAEVLPGNVRSWILADASRRFRRLGSELRSYLDLWENHDRSKLTRDHMDATTRALTHLVGT